MKRLSSFLFFLFLASTSLASNTVTDYQRVFTPVHTANGNWVLAIRVFNFNQVPSFLVVDPQSLQTSVMPVNKAVMSTPKKSNPFHFWAIMRSRYYQLLNKSTSGPYKLENQGISHARNGVRGNVLSIDLCPSSRDFEKPFFERLLALQKGSSKPIPLAISISGLWLLQHPKEFQWLLAEEKANHFAITWVNHSFSHVFYQDLPETDNFLLKTPGNLETELLLTEKYLLEAGEIPSVFIRFPGLVSNKTLVHTVKEYGLIPLGADAWLAKDQAIKPGSIILIHGNGNEHGGIKRLLPELQSLWIVDLRMVV